MRARATISDDMAHKLVATATNSKLTNSNLSRCRPPVRRPVQGTGGAPAPISFGLTVAEEASAQQETPAPFRERALLVGVVWLGLLPAGSRIDSIAKVLAVNIKHFVLNYQRTFCFATVHKAHTAHFVKV